MAVTVDEKNICGAPLVSGRVCRQGAGWGTGHPGQGRCRRHESVVPAGAACASEDGKGDPSRLVTAPRYRRAEALVDLLPDPAERMGFLARLMAERAIAAHDAAAADNRADSDGLDNRIARAVRASALATRAELAALAQRGEGGQDGEEGDEAGRAERMARLLEEAYAQLAEGES